MPTSEPVSTSSVAPTRMMPMPMVSQCSALMKASMAMAFSCAASSSTSSLTRSSMVLCSAEPDEGSSIAFSPAATNAPFGDPPEYLAEEFEARRGRCPRTRPDGRQGRTGRGTASPPTRRRTGRAGRGAGGPTARARGFRRPSSSDPRVGRASGPGRRRAARPTASIESRDRIGGAPDVAVLLQGGQVLRSLKARWVRHRHRARALDKPATRLRLSA